MPTWHAGPMVLDGQHVDAELGDRLGDAGERARPVGDDHPQSQVAPGGGQAVLDQAHEHQGIDVAAGQHRGHRSRAGHLPGQQRGQAHRAGRLDHGLGPLEEQDQSPADLLVAHGEHVVDVAPARGRRSAADGHFSAMPSAMVRTRSSTTGWPASSEARIDAAPSASTPTTRTPGRVGGQRRTRRRRSDRRRRPGRAPPRRRPSARPARARACPGRR